MGNSIRLLSTGPLQPATINMAAEHGIAIDAVSFIEITHLKNDTLKLICAALVNKKINVVFTSAQAVIAVAEITGNQQPDWDIFCIGNETLKKIKELFPNANILASGNDALEIANTIIEGEIKMVTFFCSNIRLNTLPAALEKAGINLNEIVVYETKEVHHKIKERYDGILFYSPSGVNSFFSKNEIAPDVVLFAIGNTTAEAIKQHTSNNIIVSNKPSKDVIASEAVAWFTNNNNK